MKVMTGPSWKTIGNYAPNEIRRYDVSEIKRGVTHPSLGCHGMTLLHTSDGKDVYVDPRMTTIVIEDDL